MLRSFFHLPVFLLFAHATSVYAVCDPETAKLRWPSGNVTFTVELADDFRERAEGLMFREELASSAGMLFVYERPGPVSFWMRNTLIPLDMLFFTEDGVLAHVHSNAIPLDETPIPGGDNIQYVLEINGGLADAYGLRPGAELQHPSLNQAAAEWACPASE